MADLTSGQNHRLREAMLIARRDLFEDNVTRLAAALRRSQPSISDFLNGKGGASFETARRFAKIVKKSVLEVIGEPDEFEEQAKPDLIYEDVRVNDVLAEAVRWAKMHGKSPEAIANVEGTMRSSGYAGLTPQDIVDDIIREENRLKRGAKLPERPALQEEPMTEGQLAWKNRNKKPPPEPEAEKPKKRKGR